MWMMDMQSGICSQAGYSWFSRLIYKTLQRHAVTGSTRGILSGKVSARIWSIKGPAPPLTGSCHLVSCTTTLQWPLSSGSSQAVPPDLERSLSPYSSPAVTK